MFDYFLFERYGLSEKEDNLNIIRSSLEARKEADGWENLLKAPNERKRIKAIESKKKWEMDCDILLNPDKRKLYLEEFSQKVCILIDSIEDEGEEYFETFAQAEDISLDDARKLYEKYKSSNFGNEKVDASKAIEIALLANAVSKVFDNLVISLKEEEKEILQLKGFNIDSFAGILKIDSCFNVEDIKARAKYICDVVYEIYNKQLLSPTFQKGCFELFSEESKNECSLNTLLSQEDFEKCFKVNDWVLFKYIKNTCLLMKRNRISSNTAFVNIPSEDVSDFANSLKDVFGVKVTIDTVHESKSPNEPRIPQEELKFGLQLLQKGNFEDAKIHFEKQTKIDVYGWKAYWGLFKCSINAINDEEIYFPGFLQSLHESDFTGTSPDYINYYKTAKFNAAASRTNEINFNTIELEYAKADKVNAAYITEASDIVTNYENFILDKVRNEKVHEIVKTIEKKKEELKKWKDIREMGIFVPGFIFLVASIFINLTLLPITGESEIWEFVLFLFFALPIAAGIFVAFIFGGVAGIITAVVGIGAPFVINDWLSDLASGELIFYLVFGAISIVLTALAVQRTKKYIISKGKQKSLTTEIDELFHQYTDCCFDELDFLYSDPLIAKYNIAPINVELNLSDSYGSEEM